MGTRGLLLTFVLSSRFPAGVLISDLSARKFDTFIPPNYNLHIKVLSTEEVCREIPGLPFAGFSPLFSYLYKPSPCRRGRNLLWLA